MDIPAQVGALHAVQPESRPLAGRAALVTGASRGIGRAIALQLARDGATVCIAARSARELQNVAAEIDVDGGQAIAIPCDMTDQDSAVRLVDATVQELGALTILINNVGGAHRLRPLEQLDTSDFELGTTLNYESVYRTMRAAAAHLFDAAPHSCVLNVTSIAASRGLERMSYYSGAKAAVTGLSRAVAREWGPRGVRVNCLAPGWIATDLSRPLRDNPDFSGSTLSQVPLRRWGTPQEVAEVVGFLVSDAARYITGTTVYVDGGLLA